MGNSTKTLQDVIDIVKAIPDISPQANPSGYGPKIAIEIGNKVMRDLMARPFNWKWNSTTLDPIYTNSYQQDYPLIGVKNIGWLEQYWYVDINSTQIPPPSYPGYCDRDLPVASRAAWGNVWTGPDKICWRYNKNLVYGVWPGAQKVYAPLIGTVPTPQNPPMAIKDANRNILTLTTFGTTGNAAPLLAVGAAEGQTITDGTCVWTVCDPNSQGLRVFNLPPGGGPVFQCNLDMQARAVPFTDLSQTLDPIPDDYSQYFETGYMAYSHVYSSNPADRAKSESLILGWKNEMLESQKQGEREPNSFGLVPTAQPVANLFGWRRNPMDPMRPY